MDVLEAVHELERLGVDERELLLNREREVSRGLEPLARLGHVEVRLVLNRAHRRISTALREVEVQRVEQIDRGARGVNGHVRRHLEELLGVVEDDLHAGVHQPVGDVLGSGGRDRQYPDHHVLLLDDAGEARDVVDLDLAELLSDQLRIDVEDGDDLESVVGEDVRARDRLAQIAGAEEDDVVLPGAPEDAADLLHQGIDAVADASLAELSEAREITPDLGRVDVRVLGQLLRGNRLLAHLSRLDQDLEVAREARRHAERQPVAVAERQVRRWHVRHRVLRHRCFDPASRVTDRTVSVRRSASAASSAARSMSSSATMSPSTSTTGMRSRNRACSSSSVSMSTSRSSNPPVESRSATILSRASSQRWHPSRAYRTTFMRSPSTPGTPDTARAFRTAPRTRSSPRCRCRAR